LKIESISGVLFVACLMVAMAGCTPSTPPAGQVGEIGGAENAIESESATPEQAGTTEASSEAPALEPKPAPEPEPESEPVMATVAQGTELAVMFLDGVSSAASVVGDTFRVRVTEDVIQDSIPVIPAGSVITGTVLEAVSLKKIGGKAKLALEFNRLELTSGRTVLIDASFASEGKSETKKDAATIGGAAAGGALLGRLVGNDDKKKSALIGAIVGAAAGTAVAAKTEGEEVELPTGTEIVLVLNGPATIMVHP